MEPIPHAGAKPNALDSKIYSVSTGDISINAINLRASLHDQPGARRHEFARTTKNGNCASVIIVNNNGQNDVISDSSGLSASGLCRDELSCSRSRMGIGFLGNPAGS
jgi:hypothetical protein